MAMKKDVVTKEFGFVVAVEYRKTLHIGGSIALPLTKYIPNSDVIQVIVHECNDKETVITLRKVNKV